MRTLTRFLSARLPLARLLAALLLALWLSTPALAITPPPTGRPLAEALNPDGTLRAGANGSFDARQFRMGTAPDGRPVFRPTGTTGAGDERWADGFGHPTGTNSDVRVVMRAGTNIYIGGYFSVAGLAAASRIARWDGSTWSSLGTGITGANSVVLALAVAPNGDLYAGGRFTQAGGVAANNVAKWNGTAWSALGTNANNGVSNEVDALAVTSNGDVYVGGGFQVAGGTTLTGGISVRNIAKWDGTAWSALGTAGNEGAGGQVLALAVGTNGDIYVGGLFTFVAQSISANSIAKWNGAAWSALGVGANNGVDGMVSALVVATNGDLYVGGAFVLRGNVLASLVAKWNGSVWSSLSNVTINGANNYVSALAIASNGDVYAGGLFSDFGGAAPYTFNNVAKWNGTTWSALANGPDYSVFGMAVGSNGDLYVGGAFTVSGVFSKNVVKWDGTAWNNLGAGNGVNSILRAIAVAANGDVYVGGTFEKAGGVLANNVAKWNGTVWNSLGTGTANGTDNIVYALAVAANGDLYAGGAFTQAGGIAASRVAKWNGIAWNSLGTGTANGVNSVVYALALASNGDVYVGGSFLRAGTGAATLANGIAKWNGTVWSALGTGITNGLDGPVSTLAMASNGDLYVGGSFTQAGGIMASNVAKWNGMAWSALGTGTRVPNVLVTASNGDVYAGGSFSQAGGIPASFVAKWNGISWSALGAGLTGNAGAGISAFVIAPNGDLYAGGIITQSGTIPINNIARWNGSTWSNLGTGTNKNVLAAAFGPNGKLYVGGSFSTTGDGSKPMANFGIYDPNAPLATAAAKAAPAAQLYPNPAHNTATLRLPAGAPRQPLTLSDALGRTVRRYPAPATAEAELDLRGLPAGSYVVRCGAYSQRLVVE